MASMLPHAVTTPFRKTTSTAIRSACNFCFTASLATCAILIGLSQAEPVHAQSAHGVFKTIDAQGRIIFSDRPGGGLPPTVTPVSEPSSSPAAEPIVLPVVLREAMKHYPVVIHTGNDCKPCDSAKAMLQHRGIPFEERTISTVSDHNALQKLSGQDQLPFLTIGKQHLIGWEDGEWQKYLDAAGYPKQSVLPVSWQQPVPRPLGPTSEALPPNNVSPNVN